MITQDFLSQFARKSALQSEITAFENIKSMSIDGPDGPFIHPWYLEIQKNDKNERYSFL